MAAVVVLTDLLAFPATAHRRPPNILLLVIDSLDGRLLDPSASVYAEVRLPHLRNFASSAVNFVRAYSPAPQCVPARAAMLTGRVASTLGVFSNLDGFAGSNSSLDARCVRLHGVARCEALAGVQRAAGAFTLFDALRARGYRVRKFGKVDTGGECSEDVACDNDWNGFHGRNPKEHGCTLCRAAAINRTQTPLPQPGAVAAAEEQPDFVRDAATAERCALALRAAASDGGAADGPDVAAEDSALQPPGAAARGRSRPTLVYCDLDYPHAPFYTPPPAAAAAAVRAATALGPPLPALESQHPYDAAMSVARGLRRPPPTDDARRAYRSAYLAKAAQADAFAGTVLNAASTSTLVAVVSDHGEMRLEHGTWQKGSLHEGSARVALELGDDLSRPAPDQRMHALQCPHSP